MIALGAGIVLLPINPISVILGAQLVNGVLLPIELIFILLLVNNRAMMGRYVNGRLFNLIAWGTALILIGLTIVWLGSAVIGAFV
jgi:Mn2+/Fe2+ NRAMP family transporter